MTHDPDHECDHAECETQIRDLERNCAALQTRLEELQAHYNNLRDEYADLYRVAEDVAVTLRAAL